MQNCSNSPLENPRVQRGQCFNCTTWVWTTNPDGILLPLSSCREGYLICDNNQLAKVTVCVTCEKDLIAGDTKKLLHCLEVFVKHFNGRGDLKNPVRYENSKEHWYNKGVYIPVPWEQTNNKTQLEQLTQNWAQFKAEQENNAKTQVFSLYLKGAFDFYEYLSSKLRGECSSPPGGL